MTATPPRRATYTLRELTELLGCSDWLIREQERRGDPDPHTDALSPFAPSRGAEWRGRRAAGPVP